MASPTTWKIELNVGISATIAFTTIVIILWITGIAVVMMLVIVWITGCIYGIIWLTPFNIVCIIPTTTGAICCTIEITGGNIAKIVFIVVANTSFKVPKISPNPPPTFRLAGLS